MSSATSPAERQVSTTETSSRWTRRPVARRIHGKALRSRLNAGFRPTGGTHDRPGSSGRNGSLLWNRTVVFIVGCQRSGTKWVRSIFAAHPDVVTGPESHLFPTLYNAFA